MGICSDLSSCLFSGTIPASLTGLAALANLCVHGATHPNTATADHYLSSQCRNLGSNQLSGTIPDSLSALSALQALCVQAQSYPTPKYCALR